MMSDQRKQSKGSWNWDGRNSATLQAPYINNLNLIRENEYCREEETYKEGMYPLPKCEIKCSTIEMCFEENEEISNGG